MSGGGVGGHRGGRVIWPSAPVNNALRGRKKQQNSGCKNTNLAPTAPCADLCYADLCYFFNFCVIFLGLLLFFSKKCILLARAGVTWMLFCAV